MNLARSILNFGDIVIANGDLVLTSDANPAGTNPVLQNILQNLRMFQGEWFMDTSQGLPWFDMTAKGSEQATVDALIQGAILGTPGVRQLTQYTSTANRAGRMLSVTFSAVTTSGVVDYTLSGSLPV